MNNNEDAEDILNELGERQGWDLLSKYCLLLDYVNNQKSSAALRDFLEEKADMENEAGNK